MTNDAIFTILQTSHSINNGRSPYNVLTHLTSEVGELATEIEIKYGMVKNKQPGKDGVIGEAIDIIICAVDIIYIENPQITIDEILDIVKSKLVKWENSQQ